MTTQPDTAAIDAARAEALAAIEGVTKSLQAADDFRARRDAAILKMSRAGESIPNISRDLNNLPPSTVRHAIKSAVVRSATPR